MPIDWIGKARHFLHVAAFCLALSAIQYAFQPENPYAYPLVYSLSIGLLTWFFIDFGRHLLPSQGEIGWPRGWLGVALPAAGIALGYLLGTLLGDAVMGVSSWRQDARGQLRLSVLISVLAGLGGTYYFYTRARSQWMQTKMLEVRHQAAQAQLQLLQTQLEPHMLFNTLANLRVLIGTDPERAQDMLDRMIAYLRATLTASRSTLHPLAQEFERLQDYLELMLVRMGPRLHYELDLPEALRSVQVPPLLLQPLVENAIRHGLEPQVDGGTITVRARLEPLDHSAPHWLVLEVLDTGAGLRHAPSDARPPHADTHFGLEQVRERLTTLHGDQFALELIANRPIGTCVRVTFPYKNQH